MKRIKILLMALIVALISIAVLNPMRYMQQKKKGTLHIKEQDHIVMIMEIIT